MVALGLWMQLCLTQDVPLSFPAMGADKSLPFLLWWSKVWF